MTTLAAVAFAALSTLLMAEGPPVTRKGTTRDVEEKGYRVRLDLTSQVLGINVPEDLDFRRNEPGEAPIHPTLTGAGLREGFVSGSMLAQKAKQFDDGLYAAVELAAQRGAGTFGGKAAMLRDVAARLTSPGAGLGSGNAAETLFAACRLGKVPANVPPSFEGAVAKAERGFVADPLRSKPIGFYTWTPALSDIFRQDRMLQTELEGAEGIERLARALAAEPKARATYETYLSLVDRLTNPSAGLGDLRAALRAIEASPSQAVPNRGIAVFPASRSHESDLFLKLFGDRPVPEGFSLVEEMIRRIQSGDIDLKPTARSGWYDYQTWALEPLVVPERMPEASRLRLSTSYRKVLLDLFRGILALTRETHAKQLLLPAAGEAPPGVPKVVLYVHPELSAEPLVTYYKRRAESYAFIRAALLEAFGPAGLASMHRQTAEGPVAADLASELDAIHSLFLGAAAVTSRQLGMTPEGKTDADEAAFLAWAKSAASDPDVGRDARMMVPVFYDPGRRMTKVWAFLGWSTRPVHVDFATPPTYEVTRDGRKPDAKEMPEVHFYGTSYSVAYPVMAEVYVGRLLDRDEFRKHCDKYKTRAAILGNLK
jgi:hypothetical protein